MAKIEEEIGRGCDCRDSSNVIDEHGLRNQGK